MKKIRLYIKSILVTAGLVALPLVATTPAMAIDVFQSGCGAAGQGSSGGSSSGGTSSTGGGSSTICGASTTDEFPKLMQNVISLLLIALGMIAVIAIVIGGIRYTTSNGDAGQIKSAKDTIMYAVIGLVVAIMAYAIVNFVIAQFKK